MSISSEPNLKVRAINKLAVLLKFPNDGLACWVQVKNSESLEELEKSGATIYKIEKIRDDFDAQEPRSDEPYKTFPAFSKTYRLRKRCN